MPREDRGDYMGAPEDASGFEGGRTGDARERDGIWKHAKGRPLLGNRSELAVIHLCVGAMSLTATTCVALRRAASLCSVHFAMPYNVPFSGPSVPAPMEK